jgi:SpoVK/Ycf46/Vps4 family AAA+-type ATPase
VAQSAALRPQDRTAIRAIAARPRRAQKQKPLLLTGRSARAAAEALAGELGGDIYRVDLSAVASKFIGETEKNLRRVFGEAATSGSMLLFDEADALFGKRTDVKDSHDRFANVEVSYLLELAEAHHGLVVLVSPSQRPLPAALRRRFVLRRFPASFAGH